MGRKVEELEFRVLVLERLLSSKTIQVEDLLLNIEALDARCVALEKAVETVADLLGDMSRIQRQTLGLVK